MPLDLQFIGTATTMSGMGALALTSARNAGPNFGFHERRFALSKSTLGKWLNKYSSDCCSNNIEF